MDGGKRGRSQGGERRDFGWLLAVLRIHIEKNADADADPGKNLNADADPDADADSCSY